MFATVLPQTDGHTFVLFVRITKSETWWKETSEWEPYDFFISLLRFKTVARTTRNDGRTHKEIITAEKSAEVVAKSDTL
jgi:hypothetical protein